MYKVYFKQNRFEWSGYIEARNLEELYRILNVMALNRNDLTIICL